MEKPVKKELEVYEMILKRWMNSDLAYALRVGGGGWEFLAKEMHEKFWDWMFPALHRMQDAGYVTSSELRECTSRMLEHIYNFEKALESLGGDEDNE